MNETLKPCSFCGNAVYLEKKPQWVSYPMALQEGIAGVMTMTFTVMSADAE